MCSWRFGSSPRMRGKPRWASKTSLIPGIIPAHAGQTDLRGRDFRVKQDHPRACGANCGTPHSKSMYCGSSPRMRGKHEFEIRYAEGLRIIPAHAGQTPLAQHFGPVCADHPRACGANHPVKRAEMVDRGSSPRMRGKRSAHSMRMSTSRIIPAHAGQTGARQRRRRGVAASRVAVRCARIPRVCRTDTGACDTAAGVDDGSRPAPPRPGTKPTRRHTGQPKTQHATRSGAFHLPPIPGGNAREYPRRMGRTVIRTSGNGAWDNDERDG